MVNASLLHDMVGVGICDAETLQIILHLLLLEGLSLYLELLTQFRCPCSLDTKQLGFT